MARARCAGRTFRWLSTIRRVPDRFCATRDVRAPKQVGVGISQFDGSGQTSVCRNGAVWSHPFVRTFALVAAENPGPHANAASHPEQRDIRITSVSGLSRNRRLLDSAKRSAKSDYENSKSERARRVLGGPKGLRRARVAGKEVQRSFRNACASTAATDASDRGPFAARPTSEQEASDYDRSRR